MSLLFLLLNGDVEDGAQITESFPQQVLVNTVTVDVNRVALFGRFSLTSVLTLVSYKEQKCNFLCLDGNDL